MSSSSDSSPPKSVKSDTKSKTTPPALIPRRRTYAQVAFNLQPAPPGPKPVNDPNSFVPTDSEAARLNKHDSTESKDDSSAQLTTPKYARRLIPRKYIPMDEIDEDFNEEEWMKKAYGEGVRFVDLLDEQIPEGWILIDGTLSLHAN